METIILTLKKFIRFIFSAVTLIFLLFVVLTLLTSKTTLIKNIRSFIVLTGSMQPTIPAGSIIYIQKAKVYKTGDIIAFENTAKQTVTHRIVEKTRNSNGVYYKTRGDANNTPDSELVPEKNVLGKNIFFVPYVGRFVNFLKTPAGFIAFIIFPTIIFIGLELWNIKKEIEKEVEKKVKAKMNYESPASPSEAGRAGIMNYEL